MKTQVLEKIKTDITEAMKHLIEVHGALGQLGVKGQANVSLLNLSFLHIAEFDKKIGELYEFVEGIEGEVEVTSVAEVMDVYMDKVRMEEGGEEVGHEERGEPEEMDNPKEG